MQTMKRWYPWTVGALMLLFFLKAGPAAADPVPVVLKIGTLAPEGSAWTKVFREINKELEQKTGKQVILRVFPGGVLGDEEDMLRKIKVGQIQGGFFTGGGLGLIVYDLRILAIPFLFENYREVDALMAKMAGFFEKAFLANGYKIMGWGENGFIYLLSKQPIRNAADLRKGKVWIGKIRPSARPSSRKSASTPSPWEFPTCWFHYRPA